MSRLLLVALLAIVVTGGIAAVYKGPTHPWTEDANAAAKAASTKSHVLFDPSDYASDGKPAAPESFLKAFRFDLSYWRDRLVPRTKSASDSPATANGGAPSRIAAAAPDTPKPSPTVKPTKAQPLPEVSHEPSLPADTAQLLSDAFLMAGVSRALDTQTSLKTTSLTSALPRNAPFSNVPQYLKQNTTNTVSTGSFNSIVSNKIPPLIAQQSLTGSSREAATWSRYFTLSLDVASLSPSPDYNLAEYPDTPKPVIPHPLSLDSNLSRAILNTDANLGLPFAPDAIPEPRTLLLCALAFALLAIRRSLSV